MPELTWSIPIKLGILLVRHMEFNQKMCTARLVIAPLQHSAAVQYVNVCVGFVGELLQRTLLEEYSMLILVGHIIFT